ncbi:hypothetical protein [Bacillus wiedmannii]|uniref:hypothetical protein n=1 Tax=Bacillus wiedmannii TaxID=1890302 RepID=UPI0021D2AE64|nr:hypothetical protein [Bacillus wiedmannii]MCU5577185.1 hypothetical protein [Bacillus wiedmannii]
MCNPYNTNHYPYEVYSPYNLNHSSNNFYSNQRRDPIVQLRNSAYGEFYLGIDADTGAVVLSRHPGGGVHWKMDEVTAILVTLQSRTRSLYLNYFLGINENSSTVTLSACISNNVYWKMKRKGNIVTLQNLSNNLFLGINGNTGAIELSNHQNEGTKWIITAH